MLLSRLWIVFAKRACGYLTTSGDAYWLWLGRGMGRTEFQLEEMVRTVGELGCAALAVTDGNSLAVAGRAHGAAKTPG